MLHSDRTGVGYRFVYNRRTRELLRFELRARMIIAYAGLIIVGFVLLALLAGRRIPEERPKNTTTACRLRRR